MVKTQYHIGRNSQQLGIFSNDEIRDGLAKGHFYSTDLAWNEGMPDWKQLEEIFGPLITPVSYAHSSGVPPELPRYFVSNVGMGLMPTPGTAIASLVLGIISLVTCYFGFLFAIPGVICGHMALSEIKQSQGRYDGRGLATAGLVLNYIWLGLALTVVLLFLFLGIFAVTVKP